MATYYNPKIITNNIEFSVDAANVKSWSGASSLGTDYGYFGGGGGGTKSWVDRIDFSNDTATASARGPLSQARKYLSATGNINYGYYCGGFPAPYSLVDRIDYSNDTPTAAVKGPLTSTRYNLAATGNNSYGYIGGGGPGTLSTIDRIDYSSDTSTAAAKGPLNTSKRKLTATGNTSYGYWAGGHTGSASLSVVDRTDYSNDTPTASPKGPLSGTRYSNAATGNASYGYFGGGYGGSPNAVRSIVDRIDYSSDTGTAPAKGPLAQATSTSGATGNTSYGYWAGGSESPSNGSSSQRVDYSSDTSTAVVKGPLNAVRYSTQSSSPREYGIPSTESIWKDMTGKGHDTTVEGATYQGGNSGVWDFDGSGDYASYTDQSPYPLRNWWDKAWTVEYWMKADAFGQSANGGSNVVGVTNLSTTGEVWSFGPEENGEVQWYYYNGSIQTVASGKTLSTGQWYHLVFAFDGSTGMTIFVNGVLEKSATVSGTPSGTSATFSIGKITSGGSTFNGKVALVRIYKARGFTASEVLNNFNATRTRFGV